MKMDPKKEAQFKRADKLYYFLKNNGFLPCAENADGTGHTVITIAGSNLVIPGSIFTIKQWMNVGKYYSPFCKTTGMKGILIECVIWRDNCYLLTDGPEHYLSAADNIIKFSDYGAADYNDRPMIFDTQEDAKNKTHEACYEGFTPMAWREFIQARLKLITY